MPIQFDPANKYILITSPTTEFTALELYNASMEWCDDQPTIGYDVPMRAVGKFDMGGGVYSDSIFMLINGWKLKPWSGDYSLVVSGTLLGEPGESRWVLPDSGNVSVEFQVSSQATVVVQGSGVTEQDKEDIALEVWNTDDKGIEIENIDKNLGNHITKLLSHIDDLLEHKDFTADKLNQLEELVKQIEVTEKPRASFKL